MRSSGPVPQVLNRTASVGVTSHAAPSQCTMTPPPAGLDGSPPTAHASEADSANAPHKGTSTPVSRTSKSPVHRSARPASPTKKVASLAPITKSQQSARSHPSPAAAPFTAAIVGFGMSCSIVSRWCVRRWRCQPLIPTRPAGAERRSFMAAMSPPAQNPLPRPVMMMARTSAERSAQSSTWIRSARIASLMAFRFSGRLRAMTATPSNSSVSISVVSGQPADVTFGAMVISRSECEAFLFYPF